MNNLTPEMQVRLDKWLKNPVKSAVKIRGESPGNFVSRKGGDWGDDPRDFDMKNQQERRGY